MIPPGRLDLIRIAHYLLFVYADDFSWADVADADKNLAQWSMGRLLAERKLLPPIDLAAWDDPGDPTTRIIAHFARHVGPFQVLDVGCKYGLSTIIYADFLQAAGVDAKVYGFDCGTGGRLAPYNIVNNGFGNGAEFTFAAVTDFDGYALVFSEPGHPENERVVNQLQDPITSIAPALRLDTFLSTKPKLPVVAKIDTQGGEPEVIAGFRETLADTLVAAVVEFTPHALMTRVDPAAWLAGLAPGYRLLDIGEHGGPAREIRPGEIEAYTAGLGAQGWSDVVLLPEALPAVETLIATLCGLSGR
jgi:FkbM family methyltransferase